jgi:hypothetical protein
MDSEVYVAVFHLDINPFYDKVNNIHIISKNALCNRFHDLYGIIDLNLLNIKIHFKK